MAQSRLSNHSHKLIIGYDFGTAFSSVSHALASVNNGRLESDASRVSSTRTPVSVEFNDSRKQISSELAWHSTESRWVWGDDVDEYVYLGEIAETDRIQLLKLCIEASELTQPIKEKVEEVISRLPQNAREHLMTRDSPTPRDLIAIYLKFLWKETKEQIKGVYLKTNKQDIFDECSIESWISVPVLWSAQSNHVMVTAAEWAGLPNVRLVHEPEAAASFCLIEQSERALDIGQSAFNDLKNIHPGTVDSVIIVDGGSGTADIVPYRVLAREPVLVMKEGVSGTAGLYGSNRLNQQYQDHLECLLERSEFKILPATRNFDAQARRAVTMREAMKRFEAKKKAFGSSKEKEANGPMIIHAPGLKRKLKASRDQVLSDCIKIDREKVLEFFDVIVDGLVNMLKPQITAFNRKFPQAKIGCIVFVGGLSGNQYVFDRLEQTFLKRYNISVIRPYQDSATIVSQGSVLRALHDPVRQRILKQSYGSQRHEPYCEKTHGKVKEAEIVRDFHDGVDIVQNRMCWAYKLNDVMEQNEKTVRYIRGYRGIPVKGDVLLQEPLFASYTHTEDHIAACSEGIREVGRIRLDFSHVDRSRFPKYVTFDGLEEYVELDYEIKLTFDGMLMTCELIVPRAGKWNPNYPPQEDYGPSPYKEKTDIHVNVAAFDVSGCSAYTAPAVRRSNKKRRVGRR